MHACSAFIVLFEKNNQNFNRFLKTTGTGKLSPTQTELYKHRSRLEILQIGRGELYYPSSENKGADQLHSYCKADLRLCFRLGLCLF